MKITAQVTPKVLRRVVHATDARKLAARALRRGGVLTGRLTVRWDIAGNCERPQTVWVEGRPEHAVSADRVVPPEDRDAHVKTMWYLAGRFAFSEDRDRLPAELPWAVHMEVRCRACSRCLRKRAALWTWKARAEVTAAARTWFGTMTLSPQRQYMAEAATRSRLRARGVDLDRLSSHERFVEIVATIGKEHTLWLKRVRKNSGAKLRYILVAEAHKTGLPHFHCLVHEVEPASSLRKRHLKEAWTWGFTDFKLVEGPKAAGYVCKYLAKSLTTRVRASLRYGKSLSEQSPEYRLVEGRGHPPPPPKRPVLRSRNFIWRLFNG